MYKRKISPDKDTPITVSSHKKLELHTRGQSSSGQSRH